jgi:hypothetical protein
MEISGVGVAGLLSSGLGQTRGELSEVSSVRLKAKSASEVEHHRHSHDHHSRGKALGILRQEIRQALSAHFRLHFAAPLPEFSANAGELAPGDVASDALGAATQLADRAPLDASQTLTDLRQQIEEAASSVRDTMGEGDFDDVDDALGRVSEGLDDLDNEAARNVESSATVLSADTRLQQRSTIRIRTQEGDIVRFDLRFAERFSAKDVAMTDGDMMFASTQVEVSSRTRMALKVNGDLNEAELAAVQKVFAQAESIANEFFNGDLAAAFDMAAGLEYDTEQLARVGMRFREKLVSNVDRRAATERIARFRADRDDAADARAGSTRRNRRGGSTGGTGSGIARGRCHRTVHGSVSELPAVDQRGLRTRIRHGFFPLPFLGVIQARNIEVRASGECTGRLGRSS